MKFWDKGFFLFTQIKKGDVKAFESLFKDSYSALCKFSYEYVGDTDTAEELVQDFFFNFWKNRHSINISTSLKSYIFGSVKNRSLNFLEKQRVRQKYQDIAKLDSQDLQSFSLESELNAKELRVELDRLLAKLPERCGKVFRLSRFDGLTNAQVAKKLSVSVKTVEADITKTLKLLKGNLAGFVNENEK